MKLTISENRISVNTEELDIYQALDLLNALQKLKDDGHKKVLLDMSNVAALSLPAVQVILSAKRTFDNVSFVGKLTRNVKNEAKNIGINVFDGVEE